MPRIRGFKGARVRVMEEKNDLIDFLIVDYLFLK